jgi:hypothetical protein
MGKKVDLTGQRFGRLTVIKDSGERDKNSGIRWLCKCDCGREILTKGYSLKCGDTNSCGCLKGKDLTGQRFGRLVAVEITQERSTSGGIYWKCKCDCGTIKYVTTFDLNRGHTKSCGCLQKRFASEIFGINTGDMFGNLTLIKIKGEKINSNSIGLFRCDCGELKTTKLKYAKHLYTNCCDNCLTVKRREVMSKIMKCNDFIGKRFGKVVVVELLDKNNNHGARLYKCLCDCGNEINLSTGELKENIRRNTGPRTCGKCRDKKKIMSEVSKRLHADTNLEDKVREGLILIQNTSIAILKRKHNPRKNKTGIVGLYQNQKNGRYYPTITFKGKRYFFGGYADKNDAARVYQEAKDKLHNNFIEWYENEYQKNTLSDVF